MLHITTSWSPNDLAGEMLTKINEYWKNPFVSPTVVFTDSKTEKWFNLYTLTKQPVSMNLKTARLETMLFNMLRINDTQYLMSPDLLRDVIIQKLIEQSNQTSYLNKIKNKDNIDVYLNITSNNDDIDYRHLFDLADDLSKLFIEYETTRNGIDDAIPTNDWQKDLYNDIINGELIFNKKHYLTCPEMAHKNKLLHNGQIVFTQTEHTPVFIFGFSGLGQTYRNILKELAKQSDVFVYLQTSLADGNSNIFIKHWGQFGKTNKNLFVTDNNCVTTQKEVKYHYNNDTTLGKIQNSIANDVCYNKDQTRCDNTLTINSAPSKIKELEIVHSEICKLLKGNDVTLADILVLAPDIDDYKSEIINVFNQTDKTDTQYPSIPISIVDSIGNDSAVVGALQTLYTILHDGGLWRQTFSDFVNNRLVRNTYNIDEDTINTFYDWIESMHIYRKRDYGQSDDWQDGINRMLVAKLTNRPIQLNNGEVIPFSDFNTENNELFAQFMHILFDIKYKWIDEFKDKILLTSENLEVLYKFLKDLLIPTEQIDFEQFITQRLLSKLNQYIEYTKETGRTIPQECVLLSLIDIVSNVQINTGAVFTHGVTFTSLEHNRILPAKYVFMLGMNSANFPKTNKNIIIDKRLRLPQKGDIDIPAQNKNAFLCQLMATGNKLHISFVDKDLQTDNTFYPAYTLDVLTRYTGIPIQIIGIDEKRDWNELYTPRERRNKRVCTQLNTLEHNSEINIQSAANKSNVDLPDVVSLTEIRYYLENPLKLYTYRAFGFDEDDTSPQDLESINFDKLKEKMLQKRLITPLLDNVKLVINDYQDLLPPAPFNKIQFERTAKNLKIQIDALVSWFHVRFPETKPIPNYPINVRMTCGNKKYTVRGEIQMCAYTDTDILVYYPNTSSASIKKYIFELFALVAQIAEPGKGYRIHMIYSTSDSIETASITTETITKECAESKINELYKRAFIDKNKKYIPIFSKDIEKVNTFDKLKNDFFLGNFKYDDVPHKKLLNPDTALGFTKENFQAEFEFAYNQHAELMKY